VQDLISPKHPEDQPRAQRQTPVEKVQQAWGWVQQFVKDAREYVGAHVVSMVHAHYPLVDLSCLEGGYPKEVGPREADDLCVGLLDLSSIVIGDINLCGRSTPPNQPGSERSTRELSKASAAGDGRSAPAVLTSQAQVAPTSSSAPAAHVSEQPEQQAPV
jgi:hypothetical protein